MVDLAIQAQVRQVTLFHHDPMQTDNDVEIKVEACRKRARNHGATGLTLFAAREGMELKLYGPE